MVRVIQAIGRNPAKRLLIRGDPAARRSSWSIRFHFKSNRGQLQSDIAKREEATRQVVTHVSEMEALYSKSGKVATVIAGDLNTDPTDPRFASEQTFAVLRGAGFAWCWQNTPLAERVTLPANDRYPDACFDGFLIRGARILSSKPVPIRGVSDHFLVVLTIVIE